MKFDLVSDLHVDSYPVGEGFLDWDKIKNPESRVLIIAGDSANEIFTTQQVIADARKAYEHVVFVDGNHEHYGTRLTVNEAVEFAETWQDVWPNVTFLNGKDELLLDGVLFFGCNGWYDFRRGLPDFDTNHQEAAWQVGMADARYIIFDHPPRLFAKNHADTIRQKIEAAQFRQDVEKIVLITHTVPHKKGLWYRPGQMMWNALNGSFGNSLMDDVPPVDARKKIAAWCFGHTHLQYDFDDKHIRYLANPRGYPGESYDGKKWPGPIQIEV